MGPGHRAGTDDGDADVGLHLLLTMNISGTAGLPAARTQVLTVLRLLHAGLPVGLRAARQHVLLDYDPARVAARAQRIKHLVNLAVTRAELAECVGLPQVHRLGVGP